MPEPLLLLLIALPSLAVVYASLKWAVRSERRAQAREEMKRVYYLRRVLKHDLPECRLLPEQE